MSIPKSSTDNFQRAVARVLIAILVVGSYVSTGNAAPRFRVSVQPTTDRWITFADGGKLYHGKEVSYLLAQALFENPNFLVVGAPSLAMTGVKLQSSLKTDLSREDLAERVDLDALSYLSEQLTRSSGATLQSISDSSAPGSIGTPQIIIQPRIQTLLYASGSRSNRLVYGFDPQRQNIFNAGQEGSLDNEFVHTIPTDSNASCPKPDFFGGSVSATGYGPWKTNFGANFDEGVVFEILGFGIGFKKKSFQVKSEILFDVSIPSLNFTKTYTYSTKAGGSDLFFSGKYAGISASLELQRRKTLRQALQKMLPGILKDFLSVMPISTWQTEVYSFEGRGAWVVGGIEDSLVAGEHLISKDGVEVVVALVGDGVSFVLPLDPRLTLQSLFKVREPLRFVANDAGVAVFNPWNVGLSLASVAPVVERKVVLQGQSSPQAVANNSSICKEAKYGWFESTLMTLMTVYGYVRYNSIFDQSFEALPDQLSGPRVALVASGVSPQESKLNGTLVKGGFDFLSWEDRPSDEIGTGTAAAILLREKVSRPIQIIPFKVLGAYGEIQSGELYSALDHISQRQDIDVVVVPFAPAISSQAYQMGIAKIVESGKKVIIPARVFVQGTVEAKQSDNSFKTSALHSNVQLSKEGVGVIEAASEILNKF